MALPCAVWGAERLGPAVRCVLIVVTRGQVDAVERQMRQQVHFFAGLSLAAALSVVGLLLASWLWQRPTWDFVP